MRCRQCLVPVSSLKDACAVCGSDPRLPLGDPPGDTLLDDALARLLSPGKGTFREGRPAPAGFTALLIASCARPGWQAALARADLSPIRGWIWSDAALAVAGSWLSWAGRGDEAAALLRARVAPLLPPEPPIPASDPAQASAGAPVSDPAQASAGAPASDPAALPVAIPETAPAAPDAVRSSQDGRYFSLAPAEDSRDWTLQMLAPLGGTTEQSAELESHTLLRIPPAGPCEALPGCPRLLPPDWVAFRRRAQLEDAVAARLLCGFEPPEAPAASHLARFFKETWGQFQAELVDLLENLPPAEPEQVLQQACEGRDRRALRAVDPPVWMRDAQAALLAPLMQQAAALRATHESALAAKTASFLGQEVLGRGLAGLADLGGDLEGVLSPALAEVRKTRDQGDRLALRMGEALEATLRAIQKAASSLTWPFQKPPLAEAVEQFEAWKRRLLDHQVACQTELYLVRLAERIREQVTTTEGTLSAQAARLRELARGARRLVDEVARVEDAASPTQPAAISVDRPKALAWIRGMPADAEADLWPWFDVICSSFK